MTTGEYISLGLALFNVLLGLIAFFGGIVVRGLMDSVKELRAEHIKLQECLGDYLKKDDYRADIQDLKRMVGRLFDRMDRLQGFGGGHIQD